MSTLFNLFQEKLQEVLPTVSVVVKENLPTPVNDDHNNIVINLQHNSCTTGKFLEVTLPVLTYADWPRSSLELLLQQILDNCALSLELNHQEAMYEAYLQEVKTIKEKLLPHHSHHIEGVDYAIHYSPSIGGGGDYIDIVDLRDARRRAGFDLDSIFWGGALIDVSGHGPGAAVEVAMVDAILRTYQGGADRGPGDVLTYVNKHFFTRQRRGGFVTGILCNYDAAEESFNYANAGHLPPIVKRNAGSVEILDAFGGIPIGITPDTQWETGSVKMTSGDTIIMLTDGITEARSEDNTEFGYETLLNFVEENTINDVQEFMDAFLTRFQAHVKNTSFQDDQTLIVARLTH